MKNSIGRGFSVRPSSLFVFLLLQTCAALRSGTAVSRLAVRDLAPRLFPLVEKLQAEGGRSVFVASNVSVTVIASQSSSTPKVLVDATHRAERLLRGLASQSGVSSRHSELTWTLEHVSVDSSGLVRYEEVPGEASSYEYEITCDEITRGCSIAAPGVFGLVAALQSTLPQLFAQNGRASFRKLYIKDRPERNVRGLMIDLGRRFVPIDVLRSQVIDGMALARLNVLQLHLSDNCRFSLQLPGFPELAASAGSRLEGSYGAKDMRGLVAYAASRGIRVVPEVDIPGHASRMLPLRHRGLHFCNASMFGPTEGTGPVVYDDPNGESRRVLSQLFREVADIFGPDASWFHVGGDEVQTPIGNCSRENVAGLEEYLIRDVVQGQLNRTAVAWADALDSLTFLRSTRLSTGKPSSSPEPIFVAWAHSPANITAAGYRAIDAEADRSYLDLASSYRPAASFWRPAGNEAGVLGGMAAMWTDRYCYKFQCGAIPEDVGERADNLPVASNLFDRSADAAFERSFAGMIWPRAAVAAASVWRHDATLSHSDVKGLADYFASLLLTLTAVKTCPPGCDCNEVVQCEGTDNEIVYQPIPTS